MLIIIKILSVLNHHSTYTTGCICTVDVTLSISNSRQIGKVPQSADFRSTNYDCVIGCIVCNSNRHITCTEIAHKVINDRKTIAVIKACIGLEGCNSGLAVYNTL